MAPKFNVDTADAESLRDRVKQLTTALMKQKEVIERLRDSEEKLVGEKEKLEKQAKNMQEEGEMARTMRSELQGEVARLQNELDLKSTELDMLNKKHEASGGGDGGENGDSSGAVDALQQELQRVEAENRQLTQQVTRYRGEAEVAMEQLAAMENRHERFLKMREGSSRELQPAGEAQANGDGNANPEGNAASNGAEESAGTGEEAALQEGRELELIKALAAARQQTVAGESQLADLRAELQQAQAAGARTEKAKAGAENKATALQAALDTAQVGFTQAKKRIAELEAANDALSKSMASLQQAAADHSAKRAQDQDEKTEEVVGLQEEVVRLKEQAAEKEKELQRERLRGESSAEYSRSLQAKLEALKESVARAEEAVESEKKKREEVQREGRKQQEQSQQAVNDANARVAHMQEEVDRHLAMDKQIVKRMQAESKAKVASLETALAAAQAEVKEKEEELRRRADTAARRGSASGYRAARRRSSEAHIAAALDLTPVNPRGVAEMIEVELHGKPEVDGDGAVREAAVQEAMAAVEELIEALSSDPSTAKEVAQELADLEGCLGDPFSQDRLRHSFKALRGLCRIACSHLEPLHRGTSFKQDKNIFDRSLPVTARCAWILHGSALALRDCLPCSRTARRYRSGYSSVVSSMDDDDDF